MKLIRRLHLYLGCFFAPLLIFFTVTGWHQMFHDRQKNVGEGTTLWDRLADVHVDQIYVSESAMAFSPRAFQYLVVVMAIALIITVVLGVVLAARTLRRPWTVWLTLALGVVVPVLLLWLGQRR
ncbi:MAG TPA: hypothetical protein VNO52_17460 [Methylomirabilota bacterium]|nr:hypothetical protein [Methylomirabilota bacterium]